MVFRLPIVYLVRDKKEWLTISDIIKSTENLNVDTAFTGLELPSKPDLKLYVQCLKTEGECAVSYTTAAWEKTVTLPYGESSTFAAANTRQSMQAVMTPAFYREAGNVEVTMKFYAVLPTEEEKVVESVELTAADLTVKNGAIDGELVKVDDNTYTFTVIPSSPKASFAVILNREFKSVRGLRLTSGVINGCIFDEVAPELVNDQYLYDMVDEEYRKTILLALNEPATISSSEGVVVSAAEKEGFVNTFEVVVEGAVGLCEVTICVLYFKTYCNIVLPQ